MILLGSRPGIDCEDRRQFGFVDSTIDNNQANGPLTITTSEDEEVEAIFSNAPIARDSGENVQALAWLSGSGRPRVVLAKEGNFYISGFHAGKVHEIFLERCLEIMKLPEKK